MAAADLNLPPGFRFHPTDDELVNHYLCRRCASQPIAVPIIAEIDLYKFDPWDLPNLARYGEKEWYFFSPRERKYPNGSRPNRAAGSGYWKATGADKPIGKPNGKPKPVAIKKALVFYAGKAPKGEKTNWIMHEYRLADVDRSARKKGSCLKLDDWVLCRIYNKKGIIERQLGGGAVKKLYPPPIEAEELDKKPNIYELAPPPQHKTDNTTTFNDYMQFETSESVPRLNTESSGSDQVVSPCDREVQSTLDFGFNYMDATIYNEMSPLQDMFMFGQKPF